MALAQDSSHLHELLNLGVLKSPSQGYVSLVHSSADIEATGKAFDAAMAMVAQMS